MRINDLPLRKLLCCSTVITALLLGGVASATASHEKRPSEPALQGAWGKISLHLRYRYERVVDDGLETANGDPIRLRLGYLTPKFTGFQAYAAFLGSTPIFLNDFYDSSNGKTEYALIRDPNEVALDELWLTYETIPDTIIKGGRQHIAWDNERFICNAKWRQMGQSFDSVTFLNKTLGSFSVKAAYLWTALTTENKEVAMQSPLINLNYTVPKIGSVIGYGLWLDYKDPDDSGPFEYAYSGQTYGLRLTGSPAITEGLKFLYTLEYANQSEYQDNPKNFRVDYYNIIAGLVVSKKNSVLENFGGSLGYEAFDSDNDVTFLTPLGANHRYNGWADIFGKTKPSTGLRDLYGTLSATIFGVKTDLQYHDFKADVDDRNYGTEYDIKVARKFWKHYEILVSYASYNADNYKTDTDKFWLQLTVDF